jgi:type I restriction enzyme S subunit
MLLNAGDLLFVRSSVKREGVGWAAIFPGSKESTTYCGFIIRARSKDGKAPLGSYFLVHYLRLPEIRAKLIASAGHVAITNINQERLGSIRVPLVDLSTQGFFERAARGIEKQTVTIKRQLIEFDALFDSLQRRAFSGQL